MNTRFPSPYGGTETIVGTFTQEDVEKSFGAMIPGWRMPKTYVEGKIFNIFQDRKEILGYMTRDHKVRIHCINR